MLRSTSGLGRNIFNVVRVYLHGFESHTQYNNKCEVDWRGTSSGSYPERREFDSHSRNYKLDDVPERSDWLPL